MLRKIELNIGDAKVQELKPEPKPCVINNATAAETKLSLDSLSTEIQRMKNNYNKERLRTDVVVNDYVPDNDVFKMGRYLFVNRKTYGLLCQNL